MIASGAHRTIFRKYCIGYIPLHSHFKWNVCRSLHYSYSRALNSVDNAELQELKLQNIVRSSNLGKPLQSGSEINIEKDDTGKETQLKKNTNSETSKEAQNTKEASELAKAEAATAELISKSNPNLPSQKELRRLKYVKKLEAYLDSIQDAIFTASKTLNDVTGYSAIEKLKGNVQDLEVKLKEDKENVHNCKNLYIQAITERSSLQKEINELLTRKHNWSPEDLERFTTLYRNNHANERQEQEAQKNLDKAEQKVEATQIRLTQLILARYHEEQIWSDKIRRISTWGTGALMCANILMFAIATLIIEPWKRRRMVDAFEAKVVESLESYDVGELQRKALPDHETHEQKIEDTESQTIKTQESSTPRDTVISSSNVYQISLPNSWRSLPEFIKSRWLALTSPQITTLEVSKIDFTILMSSIGAIGWLLGFLGSYLFIK